MASYRIRRFFFLGRLKKYTAPITLVTNIILKKIVCISVLCMNYIKWQEYYEALNKGIYNVLPFTVTGMPEVVCTNVNPVVTEAAELGKL